MTKLLSILLFCGMVTAFAIPSTVDPTGVDPLSWQAVNQKADSLRMKRFTDVIRSAINNNNQKKAKEYADSLRNYVEKFKDSDSLSYATAYYWKGLSYSIFSEPTRSFQYFDTALKYIRTDKPSYLLGRIYYNIGRAYNELQDHVQSAMYYIKGLQFGSLSSADDSTGVVKDYISLAIENIYIREYAKSLRFTQKALDINDINRQKIDSGLLASIYQQRGVAYSNFGEYVQALTNYEKSFNIYKALRHRNSGDFINLINNLATTYFNLGENKKCLELLEKYEGEAGRLNDRSGIGLLRNYAIILALTGDLGKSELVYLTALKITKKDISKSPDNYYDLLVNYAAFKMDKNADLEVSIKLFRECFNYVNTNHWDKNLNSKIMNGYSLALLKAGRNFEALDSINSALFFSSINSKPVNNIVNPPVDSLKADSKTLSILDTKYLILKSISDGGENNYLHAMSETAGIIIDLLERIRKDIGEEKSRIILGDRYRDAYLNAIYCNLLCFKRTGDETFRSRAFEVAEQSKAASLLASMHELNALKASVPEEKIVEERDIQRELSYYKTLYDEENGKRSPDSAKLAFLDNRILVAMDRKNQLIDYLKTNYPEYTKSLNKGIVASVTDIRKLIGRNKDYISYIVSDSVLYTLLINRKTAIIKETRIDSTFKSTIRNFRQILSNPEFNGGVRKQFIQFQEYGYRLYSWLIKPVEDQLASDDIVISTDNMLAYFPFEALVTDSTIHDDMYYSRLPYLMRDYRISYAYSATLLAQTGRARTTLRNKTAAFAPSYNHPIWVDSIKVNRQQADGPLPNLKYAGDEARFVTRLTSGVIFSDSLATKKRYISEAGKYDIIHLAMHTVLNSKDPLNSGMIFYGKADQYLQPYEIYSVMLKAKMVVLSSCYTGAGTLYTGEGVLSLARGFTFSGSQSVVMSLWEVNDKSGTEIVSDFYTRLKAGNSKSEALRRARINYLKGSDMQRSHPYFWSTLVVYGDDSPLYINNYIWLVVLFLPAALAGFILLYFRKR